MDNPAKKHSPLKSALNNDIKVIEHIIMKGANTINK
uniref:Ankyrin repeat protein n=1 Tax=viral metagenome TaxID=1070528 RepID=A0A6C0D419_9ZZZZ